MDPRNTSKLLRWLFEINKENSTECFGVLANTERSGCRVYPYLCRSVRNFARDHGNVPHNKEFYVALEDLPTRNK